MRQPFYLLTLFLLHLIGLSSSIQASVPVVQTENVWTATKGIPFHYIITASDHPTTFSVMGLPNGLTLDPNHGIISGTTTATGVYTLTLGATNNSGTGTANLSLKVTPDVAKGNDISELQQMAGSGFQFFDTDGQMRDPDQITNCLKIMRERNLDLVRIRIMVPPIIDGGWDVELYGNCTIDEMAPMAAKAQALGFRILISIDFSWTLADPDNQRIPVNWAEQIAFHPEEDPINLLAADVSAHTTEVLTKLKAVGVTPEFISLFNETPNGMLLNVQDYNSNFPPANPQYGKGGNMAKFINAGYYAVKAIDPNIKVVLHCNLAHNDGTNESFYGAIKKYNGHWDVSGTDTSVADIYCPAISNTVNNLAAHFNTPGFGGDGVMMMEMEPTSIYASRGSIDASFGFITDILHVMRTIPGGKGLGSIYWDAQSDPDWRGYLQAAWENEEPTSALDAFIPTTLQASGINIVDGNGVPVPLKGINLEGDLVMNPAVVATDSSGLVDEYSIRQKLDQRFGVSTEQSLMQNYQQSWVTTSDFDHIRA